MAIAAVCEITLPKTNTVRLFFEFVGNPAVALFIAIVIAIFTLGRRNGRTIEQIMDIIGGFYRRYRDDCVYYRWRRRV